MKIIIRGAGEIASGVACTLFNVGFKIVMTEIQYPLSIRRFVSFSEAIYNKKKQIGKITARLVKNIHEIYDVWDNN